MAKTVKRKAMPVSDEIELRRWCIDQARSWPMYSPYQGAYGQLNQPFRTEETDVIGRAEKIFKWVTAVRAQ